MGRACSRCRYSTATNATRNTLPPPSPPADCWVLLGADTLWCWALQAGMAAVLTATACAAGCGWVLGSLYFVQLATSSPPLQFTRTKKLKRYRGGRRERREVRVEWISACGWWWLDILDHGFDSPWPYTWSLRMSLLKSLYLQHNSCHLIGQERSLHYFYPNGGVKLCDVKSYL